jgi:hypothetical protein
LLSSESQDANTLSDHEEIAGFVVKSTLLGEVIASIDLDDKSFFSAIEIRCVDADWMLPTELLVAPTSITQQLPEQSFVTVLTPTQVSSELFLVHWLHCITRKSTQHTRSSSPSASPRITEEKGRQ